MSTCRLCDSDRYSLGLCRSHYEKDLRRRNPAYAQRQRENSVRWQRENDYKEDPVVVRQRNVLRTEAKREQLAEQLARQSGRCGLCGAEGKTWHYDHDHQTGKLRLVLCSKCNNGLGFFDDEPELLRAAAAYVEAYRMGNAAWAYPHPEATPVVDSQTGKIFWAADSRKPEARKRDPLSDDGPEMC